MRPRFFSDPESQKRFDQLSQQEQNDTWDNEPLMTLHESGARTQGPSQTGERPLGKSREASAA